MPAGARPPLAPRSDHALADARFPRSSRYDPEWVFENQMGPNALWLTEWLAGAMALEPGMRVLDMGAGRAISSVFLAAEYGVEVWANDLWIGATDNWGRIRAAGMEGKVHPIHAEAHDLPYAEGFFDAILSMDSYQYYGTDDLYLRPFSATCSQFSCTTPISMSRPYASAASAENFAHVPSTRVSSCVSPRLRCTWARSRYALSSPT